MVDIKNYDEESKILSDFLLSDEFSSKEYWLKKGKKGKLCILYVHDDLDGIFSGIIMKNWLISKGFEIGAFALVNYQESWKAYKTHKTAINIALDLSYLREDLDVYIDHHGKFEDYYLDEHSKDIPHGIKAYSDSAFGEICRLLKIDIDDDVISIINMIDAAKYDDYGVDINNLLHFDTVKKMIKETKIGTDEYYKNKEKNKKLFKDNILPFTAEFNQLIKRSDYKTIIEVIHNSNDLIPNIYDICHLFIKFSPSNNYGKDFVENGIYRFSTMVKKTRGEVDNWGETIKYVPKTCITSQEEFEKICRTSGRKNGYRIFGNLMYVPSSTWCNPIRARMVLQLDILSGKYVLPTIELKISQNSKIYNELKKKIGEYMSLIGELDDNIFTVNNIHDIEDVVDGFEGTLIEKDNDLFFQTKRPIYWILLQYENMLQIVAFKNINSYAIGHLPKSNGKRIANLGEYTSYLLECFISKLGYNPNYDVNATTTAGGHRGIGSASNLYSEYKGTKNIDLMKNKMIKDFSGISWKNKDYGWYDNEYIEEKKMEKNSNIIKDYKLILSKNVRTLDSLK